MKEFESVSKVKKVIYEANSMREIYLSVILEYLVALFYHIFTLYEILQNVGSEVRDHCLYFLF
jgi:hypothetical protein